MANRDWKITHPALSIVQLERRSILVLRIRTMSADLLGRIDAVLGTSLPQAPNTVNRSNHQLIAWMAPSEWMIVGAGEKALSLCDAVAGTTSHVAEVGDGRVQFVVSGDLASSLLAKGTSLDFHVSVFGPDMCAQTLFAQTFVLIEREGETSPSFVITADISYADHLERWFADASLEFTHGKATA